MYLMNVPPVAATQTEWRRCGPPGGFSLPVCFNDSDTELSARGTPISDKVQMIIESLRSTQSSLEMGDEIEGNVLSGQESHTQVCKAVVGSYVGAKCKTKSPPENPQAVSSMSNHDSSDSDSDDSVDRGIEEAILEYLKEKDGHKRKTEPCSTFLHSSKIPRKNPPILEVSKTNITSNSQLLRNVKTEAPIVTATIPLKKYIKNKVSLDETFDLNTNSMKSLLSSKEQMKSPSKPISHFSKCPVTVKVDADSNDSSSDDGIEEAIQRYQLEKKEQHNKSETFNPHAFQEESDSTSDDGIEEAIRSYQLEQLKEKSVLKPLLQKQKPFSKPFVHAMGSTSVEKTKKHKLKIKKGHIEKQIGPFQLHPSSNLTLKTFSDDTEDKGNGLLSVKEESLNEQPAPAPSKVNTTAELMCAEAILDISKTVMPGAFHHNIGLNLCAPTSSPLHSSVPNNCPYEESNDSSIDSEDGIEQEIRKFLEQKAQMHKQPPSSQEPCDISESERVKVKEGAIQKKHRLSLTQRRKHREKGFSVSSMSGTGNKGKETSPMPLLEPIKESNPLTFTQRNQTFPITALHKTDQSGDKSSSLDSDEDLDTAIKDLLKTKKKSKKKIRDLKRKSRKCIKDEDPVLGGHSLIKKFKPEHTSKCSALKKVHKNNDDIKDKSGLNRKSALQQKQMAKTKELYGHKGEMETLKGADGGDGQLLHLTETHPLMKDDSSSVDSDDSIEQEIRRFLAEKAKVSTAEKTKDEDLSRNGTVMLTDADIKQETQLAEIPRKSTSPLSGSSGCPVQDKTPQRPPDICLNSPQSCVSSVQSCSPSLLEPADGAGAARNEQGRLNIGRDDVQDASHQTERDRPVMTPNIAHSRAESIKWRQSLGLPIYDKRTPSRTLFQITSSEIREDPPTTLPNKSFKSQTPASAWFSSRTNKALFPRSPETVVNTTVRPPVLKFFSAARQHSWMSLSQSLTPANRSQFSLEEERASMVHMPKDKSVFVELESNRTNHVQVQSRERSEGKEGTDLQTETSESESVKIDNKEIHQDSKEEEEFIDESDCESGSKKDPENKQGISTLSLSRAIDPGISFSPCIALTTEERSKMFSRKHVVKKAEQGKTSHIRVPDQKKSMQHIKRKLQFLPVNRT